jgi:hypothetical protein
MKLGAGIKKENKLNDLRDRKLNSTLLSLTEHGWLTERSTSFCGVKQELDAVEGRIMKSASA